MQKLKQRWGIQSNFQLVVVFIVFAINGSASAKLGFFLLDLIGMTKEIVHPVLRYVLMLVLVLPIYPFLIMLTGWIFGQSEFFVRFGKNMLNRISFGLLFDYKKNS
ncbi:hypothetical protein FNO01nite_18750 [Flavobacterium noncentrifugens]|uniref:DUF6787 domain-containing protein n=1 Tax=Flavobacterium noncentrifugens TaxID=1128970 RepID=A0A1G8YF19_9FLAO|nr:DUF6787 family protein [Flavobacterium noncentrifugens]GEP51203.1 hypothetical protein FNO01nite_18750 [Flavobacterium noncentrifugens]SDK01519.1 hypothetical protein SAMN04487935_2310 [Flavobacterium noncentrifugens]